jgi:acyl transferase domain-containing protein
MSAGGTDIAIIGMAGRFPGAKTLEQFWRNLCDGVESVSIFPEPPGLPANLSSGKYVPVRAVVTDIDLFDPSFFGYSPAEASIMDPQQRLFLECSWEALEDAGYDPGAYPGAISLYAGCTTNTYLLTQFSPQELPKVLNDFQTVISNDKDFLVTRVSYKLNLRGPSVNVQSACSTSLVAVHFACQSLLTGESDMAMAGGVCVRLPQGLGYFHQPGGIYSSDGHCRAFDQKADGTIPGNGLGLVVLRRLADAQRDGDHIYAVIKGTAINNDGSAKVGFTAPSVAGQASVIAEAMAIGGVSPEEIQYIETHGTGTSLGDPIEITALTQAFQAMPGSKSHCAIGSIKPNIGHLDAAAGIAGLIKAALALKHGKIPPSLHFENPNPDIEFTATPFFVNKTLSEWTSNGTLRHAGVSSFGIGGTNAHAVLEEAPQTVRQPHQPGAAEDCLVTISARTSAQLTTAISNLASHLRNHHDLNLADVAYTLQTGRRAFGHRAMVLATTVEDAITRLTEQSSGHITTSTVQAHPKLVLFLAADGAVRPGELQELYRDEPVFREEFDQCAAHVRASSGHNLQNVLAADNPGLTAQAAFAVCYALAKIWLRSGVSPQLLAGDRAGVCVAACIAGVLSLQDALALAAYRNSGANDTHAPQLSAGQWKAPQTPILSLLTGSLISDAEAINVEYWTRKTAPEPPKEAGLNALFESPDVVVLEAGTPSEFSPLIRSRAEAKRQIVISSLPEEVQNNLTAHLWRCRGRLWLAGIGLDWRKCHRGRRYRVSLPAYPFERQKCWIGPPDSSRVLPNMETTTTATGQVRHPRPDLPTPYQAPETDIQQRLVSLWQELLGVESVGVGDNFFELGGHSLIAVQLVSRLREIFDVNIEPEAVFETENIVQLANAVEEALVQQVAEMSEEEAEAQLNKMPDQ